MKLTLKTKKVKNLSANHAMQAQLTPLVQGGVFAGVGSHSKPCATGSNVVTCENN